MNLCWWVWALASKHSPFTVVPHFACRLWKLCSFGFYDSRFWYLSLQTQGFRLMYHPAAELEPSKLSFCMWRASDIPCGENHTDAWSFCLPQPLLTGEFPVCYQQVNVSISWYILILLAKSLWWWKRFNEGDWSFKIEFQRWSRLRKSPSQVQTGWGMFLCRQ